MAAALLGVVLLGAPLDVSAVPAAQASELAQWWQDRDNCDRGDRGDRGGWGGRGGGRECREDRHHEGRRRERGGWDGWERNWHDRWGDCFRTPWGLACETGRSGVYRVRDRHRGDEPGPDCDILIAEDWGWRCYDSPRR